MKGNILSDSRGRCVGKDRSRSDDVTQVRHWSDQCCHVVFICRKSVVCSAAQCRIDDVLYPAVFGEGAERPPWLFHGEGSGVSENKSDES